MIVIVADPLVNETAFAIGKDISVVISAAVLVGDVDENAVLEKVAFAAVVNTPDGNVILTVSPLANACEIFIVIVKVPVATPETGFVHTAELPWEESAPPEDAHLPIAASHVVPTSQHPGP